MNLLDIVSGDTKLKRISHDEYHGPCPFCGGKDRFRVQLNHNGKDYWACRKCEKHGDTIAYLQEKRGLSFKEARDYVGDTPPPTPTSPHKLSAKQRLAWQKVAGELVQSCKAHIWSDEGKPGLDYLHARALKDKTIERMCLGYNDRQRPFGLDDATVIAGVTIPSFVNGKVTSINVRRLNPQGKEKKYQAVKHSDRSLFYLAGDRQVLAITEGEFDAMLVSQQVGVSVAALGTTTRISSELNALIKKFERVILLPDNDDAGEDMVKKWQGLFSNLQVFRLPEDVHDVSDFVCKGRDLDKWWRERVAAAGKVGKPVENPLKKPGKDPKVPDKTILFKLARKRYVIFEDQFGEAYAEFPQTTHTQIAPVASRVITRDLGQLFLRHSHDKPAGRRTIGDVCQALETTITGMRILHNRVMTEPDSRCVRYDLLSHDWLTVSIRPSGWQFEKMPHPIFRRYKHMKPQSKPVPGGDINELWDFLPQLGDDDTTEKHRLLVLTFLVGGIVLAQRPAFALILSGTEGSGKTNASLVLRELIDPSSASICRDSHDLDSLTHYCCHNRVVILDNLSYIKIPLSDFISSAITGTADTKRKNYTDDDDVVRAFQPVFILTGISNVVQQPDLLDRCLSIHLKILNNPEAESSFRKRFLLAKPRIFGALLDLISKAMVHYPKITLTEPCRMADAAQWGVALTRALGRKDAEFYEAYSMNARENLADIVKTDILSTTIVDYLSVNDEFRGTPTELFETLTTYAGYDPQRPPKTWPIDATRMSRRLNILQRPLEHAGIYYRSTPGTRRIIRLWLDQDSSQPDWVNSETDNDNTVPKDDANDANDAKVFG
ncbi:MAG TPA: CHC2 zinc finger domain-containing protein [bacterium]|nr:CHC2 zinc finger domain-containing protein [bacterium]